MSSVSSCALLWRRSR